MKEFHWLPEYIGKTKTRMQILLWLDQIIEWKEREAGIKRPTHKKIGSGLEMQQFLGGANINRGHAGRTDANSEALAQRDSMLASVFESMAQPPPPPEPMGNHTIDDAVAAIAYRGLSAEEKEVADLRISASDRRAQADAEAQIEKALREAGG